MLRRFLTACVCAAVFSCFSCDPAAPVQPDFIIDSLVFTGDSVGTVFNGELQYSEGEPYCQFTVSWNSPSQGDDFQYTVYRSLLPGISSNPSQSAVLGTTTERSWVDGEGLEWGTEYYYAVSAYSRTGTTFWSSEAYAAAPSNPLPRPSLLTFQKTGFTDCFLSWTIEDDNLTSFTLLRSSYPEIHRYLWNAETLFVSSSTDSLSFQDHLVSPNKSTFYVVCVTDTAGTPGYSNEVEFSPGGELPWTVSTTKTVYGLLARLYGLNSSGTRITASRQFAGYSFGETLSTSDGGTVNYLDADPRYMSELDDGSVIVSHITSEGYRLSLFDQNLEEELTFRDFPPVQTCLELQSGLFLGSSAFSTLVDPFTLETIESYSFGFQAGAVSSDGERVFILDYSGILALDGATLSIIGSIPGSFTGIQIGADGNLRALSYNDVTVYDPNSLYALHSFDFPETACSNPALLPSECNVVYVPVTNGEKILIRVLDILTEEDYGTVNPVNHDYITITDFLASPAGDYLWGLGVESDMSLSMFRISLFN